jgi:hypothetical protein
MTTNYITGATNESVQAVAFERNIGLLLTPDTAGLYKNGKRVGGYANKIDLHPYIGLDNGGFGAKGRPDFEDRWVAWITKLASQLTPAQKAKVIWAAVPDVLTWHPAFNKDGSPKLIAQGPRKGEQDIFCIGHARPTLELFHKHVGLVKELGFPVAFVAQDGIEEMLDEVPWAEIDAIFLGGSDDFKIGEAGRIVTARAKAEGKLVHMGRVNSERRLTIANSWDCDTADGTYLRFGPDENLPKLLSWLDAIAPEPMPAPVVAGPPATEFGPVCGHCTHFEGGRRVQVRHFDTGSIRTCGLLRRAA